MLRIKNISKRNKLFSVSKETAKRKSFEIIRKYFKEEGYISYQIYPNIELKKSPGKLEMVETYFVDYDRQKEVLAKFRISDSDKIVVCLNKIGYKEIYNVLMENYNMIHLAQSLKNSKDSNDINNLIKIFCGKFNNKTLKDYKNTVKVKNRKMVYSSTYNLNELCKFMMLSLNMDLDSGNKHRMERVCIEKMRIEEGFK